jgi:hypothetical protein
VPNKTPSTAPPGYRSLTEALLELCRFGFGLWGPAKNAVLLFHVERSAAYGRESDAHSVGQAMSGVHSRQYGWVRGPIGVSRSHYHRINGELEKCGLLLRHRRRAEAGDSGPTEFAPDFLKIRAAITAYKQSLTLPRTAASHVCNLERSSPGGTTVNSARDNLSSQPGTTPVSHRDDAASRDGTHSEMENTQVDSHTSGVVLTGAAINELRPRFRQSNPIVATTRAESVRTYLEAFLEAADKAGVGGGDPKFMDAIVRCAMENKLPGEVGGVIFATLVRQRRFADKPAAYLVAAIRAEFEAASKSVTTLPGRKCANES